MCERFSERLRSARKARKLSQAAFAESMDLSSRTIQEWEAGNNHPEFKSLLRLAAFFERPVGWFFGEEQAAPSPVEERLGRIEALLETVVAAVPAPEKVVSIFDRNIRKERFDQIPVTRGNKAARTGPEIDEKGE